MIISEAEVAQSQCHDFRIHLQNEFIRKCKINPKFSIRAFAKQLEMDSSTLSKLISGQRPLTRKKFIILSKKLGLGPAEHKRYLDVLTKNVFENNISDESNYQQLTLDTFSVISDWYHYAILELMEIKGFKFDPKWISKKLNISANEVKIALERLQRVGLIQLNKDGSWADKTKGYISTIDNEFTHSAFRNLQKQVLQKALTALEEIPLELRDQTSMTMAINLKQLPEAKEMIKKFRRKLCTFFNKDKEKDEVFHLGISLYPVTQIERRKL